VQYALDPGGRFLAVSDNAGAGGVEIYDVARERRLGPALDVTPTSINALVISADGRTLLAGGIGPVRRNKSEAIWNRFRAACDTFFERFKTRDQVAADLRLGRLRVEELADDAAQVVAGPRLLVDEPEKGAGERDRGSEDQQERPHERRDPQREGQGSRGDGQDQDGQSNVGSPGESANGSPEVHAPP